MKSLIQICVFFTLTVVVMATCPCDPEIVKKIRKEGGASITRVMTTAPEHSPFCPIAAAKGEFPPSLECVSSKVFKPEGEKYPVISTFQFENGNYTKNEYYQVDAGEGHVLEYSINTKEKTLYHLYYVQLFPCACYYRCSEAGKDSYESGYCSIPASSLNNLNDPALKKGLEEGMAKLNRAGVKNITAFKPRNCKKELLKNDYYY